MFDRITRIVEAKPPNPIKKQLKAQKVKAPVPVKGFTRVTKNGSATVKSFIRVGDRKLHQILSKDTLKQLEAELKSKNSGALEELPHEGTLTKPLMSENNINNIFSQITKGASKISGAGLSKELQGKIKTEVSGYVKKLDDTGMEFKTVVAPDDLPPIIKLPKKFESIAVLAKHHNDAEDSHIGYDGEEHFVGEMEQIASQPMESLNSFQQKIKGLLTEGDNELSKSGKELLSFVKNSIHGSQKPLNDLYNALVEGSIEPTTLKMSKNDTTSKPEEAPQELPKPPEEVIEPEASQTQKIINSFPSQHQDMVKQYINDIESLPSDINKEPFYETLKGMTKEYTSGKDIEDALSELHKVKLEGTNPKEEPTPDVPMKKGIAYKAQNGIEVPKHIADYIQGFKDHGIDVEDSSAFNLLAEKMGISKSVITSDMEDFAISIGLIKKKGEDFFGKLKQSIKKKEFDPAKPKKTYKTKKGIEVPPDIAAHLDDLKNDKQVSIAATVKLSKFGAKMGLKGDSLAELKKMIKNGDLDNPDDITNTVDVNKTDIKEPEFGGYVAKNGMTVPPYIEKLFKALKESDIPIEAGNSFSIIGVKLNDGNILKSLDEFGKQNGITGDNAFDIIKKLLKNGELDNPKESQKIDEPTLQSDYDKFLETFPKEIQPLVELAVKASKLGKNGMTHFNAMGYVLSKGDLMLSSIEKNGLQNLKDMGYFKNGGDNNIALGKYLGEIGSTGEVSSAKFESLYKHIVNEYKNVDSPDITSTPKKLESKKSIEPQVKIKSEDINNPDDTSYFTNNGFKITKNFEHIINGIKDVTINGTPSQKNDIFSMISHYGDKNGKTYTQVRDNILDFMSDNHNKLGDLGYESTLSDFKKLVNDGILDKPDVLKDKTPQLEKVPDKLQPLVDVIKNLHAIGITDDIANISALTSKYMGLNISPSQDIEPFVAGKNTPGEENIDSWVEHLYKELKTGKYDIGFDINAKPTKSPTPVSTETSTPELSSEEKYLQNFPESLHEYVKKALELKGDKKGSNTFVDFVTNTSGGAQGWKNIVSDMTTFMKAKGYEYESKDSWVGRFYDGVVGGELGGGGAYKHQTASQKDVYAPKQLPKDHLKEFPEKLDDLDVIKTNIGGTNGASIVRDNKSGKQFVKKTATNENKKDQLRDEVLADSIYDFFGLNVPKTKLYENADGSVSKLSEFIEGDLVKDTTITGGLKQDLQKGFAVDALLANWDVVGHDDNVMVSNGKMVRIDNGGALRHSGLIGPKGDNFEDEVGELWSMRKPENMRKQTQGTVVNAQKMFSDMSYDDVMEQVGSVVKNRSGLIKHLKSQGADNAIIEKLSKRMDSLKVYHDMYTQMVDNDYKSSYTDGMSECFDLLGKKKVLEPLSKKLKKGYSGELLDENGKAFDNIRGTGSESVSARFWDAAKSLGSNGGYANAIETYLASNGGSSHGWDCDAMKYGVIKNATNKPFKDFWFKTDKSEASYASQYDQFLSTYGVPPEKGMLPTQMIHALTQRMLRQIEIPNVDRSTQTAILLRSEHTAAFKESLIDDSGTMGVPSDYEGTFKNGMRRGALASYSLLNPVHIGASNDTVQTVPFCNIYATYLNSKQNSSHTVLHNDRENEVVAMHTKKPLTLV